MPFESITNRPRLFISFGMGWRCTTKNTGKIATPGLDDFCMAFGGDYME